MAKTNFPGLTKEDFIQDYRRVQNLLSKEKINRNEYLSYGAYPRYYIEKLFGSWNEMKLSLGEKPLMHKRVTKDMVILSATELYNKYGKLTAQIMREEGLSQISVDKHFGSFSNMMDELGFEQASIGRTRSLSDDEFLKDLVFIEKKFGYVNSELLKLHSDIPLASFINRYRTFGEACLKANVRHIGQITINNLDGEAHETIKNISLLIGDESYHTELTFDWLRNDVTGSPLPVDAFFPEHNLVVEYNGPYHYAKDFWLNKEEGTFEETQRRDSLKDKLCKDNGLNIVWIHHEEKDSLESLFKDFIK